MFNVSKVVDDEGDLVQLPRSILNDRNRFKPITAIILRYCSERGLAIDNAMLTVDPKGPMDQIERLGFVCNVYSDNPLFHSHGVANMVYEQCTKYVSLNTNVPRREFELFVLGRIAARFYQYPSVKAIRAGHTMDHVRYHLQEYKLDVEVLDPEIQLIGIYRQLYRPYPENWHKYQHFENVLFGLLDKRYGGAQTEGGVTREHSKTARTVRRQLYELLPDAMPEAVIVGPWALKTLIGVDPEWEKLQLLVEPFEPETLVQRLNNMLGDTELRFSWDVQDATILDDYWLKRCTFRIHLDGEKVPILDVFNSLEYEIIPYVEREGYRVGNPFVIARFLLVDRWVLSLLHSIKLVPEDMYKRKAASIYRWIHRLRKLDDLCWGEQYAGVYKDLVVERRRFIREQEKYPRYEPELYKRAHDHLRTLEK